MVSKVEEELGELKGAIAAKDNAGIVEEVGDLLFAVANLARHLGVDPETALEKSNHKFTRRFKQMESALTRNSDDPGAVPLEEMERIWQEVKSKERQAAPPVD